MAQKSFFKQITYTEGIYPSFSISHNQNPSVLYAIPVLGLVIKLIALLPVAVFACLIAIWWLIAVVLINPFVVLTTGKYWQPAYEVAIGLTKMSAKIAAYFFGLTDKYPGFDFNLPEGMHLDLPMIHNPNKLYAIPVLGGAIRIILLIPYLVFEQIISRAVLLGVAFIASFYVLIKGKYPEAVFELARDSIRINSSAYAYMAGLSDKYPSFHISMAHDKIKLILIAIAIIWFGTGVANNDYKNDRDINDRNTYKNFLLED